MGLFRRATSSSNTSVDICYGADELEELRYEKNPYNQYANACTKSTKSSKGNLRAPSSGSMSGERSLQRSKSSKFSIKSVLQYFIIGILSTQCFRSLREVQRVTQELNQLQEDYEYTHQNLVHLEEELDSAHEDFHKLQMKILASQSGEYYHHSEIGEEERKEVAMGIIQKHDHQASRIDHLQKSIQKNYEVELERRFGPGPYYIEFQINIDGKRKFLTIETAPNNIMPHSVYYFMDMVDRKVWDSTVLMHDREHIISAVLQGPDGESKLDTVQERLAFPEYSHEFEHEEFTVGFAGHGPNFYFNVQDNSEVHGPDGINPHGEADPCFAKAIIGAETMKLLKQKSMEAAEKSEDVNVVFSHIEKVARINLSATRVKELGGKRKTATS